ncbi:MAG TPA: NADH:flavin oxidoreductase/NADH oxidase [Alphaproteobacteria bacterium]|nr:NADH:flavin oxidoreductase/NADH oxidase [Alphaproteobacteria bacterium]
MSVPLFTPLELRDLRLNNRIAVSPMCQYICEDGSANDWHIMHLGQFCMGGAGLVIAEATHVSREGRISHRCLGLYSDENERALQRVVDFCRRHGMAALGIQLAHAGRKGSTRPPGEGGTSLKADEGAWTTLAPSAVPYADDWHTPQALDTGGLATVKEQFVAAAERAARIGFDLAELHCAHGYLLHQFLSPLSNRREDGYGGSLENRMRFPLEVLEAVRAAWPPERPLGIRVSATDWVEGGWDIADTVRFVAEAKALGCDFADVSSGGLDPRQQIPLGPGYQVRFAERVRRETGIATMAVGMIREPRLADEIVARGQADMVALARGMMWDPRWGWHAAHALGAETDYAPQYQRCRPERWPQAFPGLRDAAE